MIWTPGIATKSQTTHPTATESVATAILKTPATSIPYPSGPGGIRFPSASGYVGFGWSQDAGARGARVTRERSPWSTHAGRDAPAACGSGPAARASRLGGRAVSGGIGAWPDVLDALRTGQSPRPLASPPHSPRVFTSSGMSARRKPSHKRTPTTKDTHTIRTRTHTSFAWALLGS